MRENGKAFLFNIKIVDNGQIIYNATPKFYDKMATDKAIKMMTGRPTKQWKKEQQEAFSLPT